MEIHILTRVPEDWDDPILSAADTRNLLSQPHHVLLGVGEDGAGGHLLASLMPHMAADILTLFIPTGMRRNGYARKLVEAALTAARNARCTGLTLEVNATNTAAINLYRVCGLQQVSIRANYYHDAVSNLKADALVMAVSLA